MDYCRKCKRQTKSIGEPKFIKKVKRWRRISTCSICNSEKNNISKSPEDIELIELFKPYRVHFPTRHFIQKGIDDTWQADLYSFYRPKGKLVDPSYNFRHERKEVKENDYKVLFRANSGFTYILNVIDTFSKFAWAVPLKTKGGAEVAAGLLKIIKESGRNPKKFHVDEGKEFYNKEVKKILEKYGMQMYSTGSENKASIVERFNRTLGDKLKPIIYQNIVWVDVLPKIIKTYNNSYHRTIKMRPVDVSKDNENQLLSTVYRYRLSESQPKFEVGDRVRLSSFTDLFRNKLKTNWTREIFTVSKVFRTNVIYYNLKDITGCVYEEELLLSKM